MRTFELGEELPCWLHSSISLVLQAPPNAFFSVSLRGNIQQPLGGLGHFQHCRALDIQREHIIVHSLLQMLHGIHPTISPKSP
jgi:hypothetical protein